MLLLRYLVIATFVLVTGCASNPQMPISFLSSDLGDDDKIVILSTEVESPVMDYPGASCLLCLAAAATANASLSKHTKTLPITELTNLSQVAAQVLSDKKIAHEVVETPIILKKIPKHRSKAENSAKFNFGGYKQSHGATHVAVIQINRAGMIRSYSAYAPTDVPKAHVSGVAYIVDLATNTYVSYSNISSYIYAEQVWKESPDYPSLTNAYFQAVDSTADKVKATFTLN